MERVRPGYACLPFSKEVVDSDTSFKRNSPITELLREPKKREDVDEFSDYASKIYARNFDIGWKWVPRLVSSGACPIFHNSEVKYFKYENKRKIRNLLNFSNLFLVTIK